MGAGASAMPMEMMKEMPEDKVQEIAEQMPPEAIAILKKVVAAAEEHQKSKPAGEQSATNMCFVEYRVVHK